MFGEICKFLDEFDGFYSSLIAKTNYKGNRDTSRMTYGECAEQSLVDIIEKLKKYKKLDGAEELMDMGSGIGKLAVALHSTNFFKNVHGVELLEGLCKDSLGLIGKYSEKFGKNISNITIYNDDMLNIDLSRYDVIIANLQVDEELIDAVIKKINKEAKKDAVIISSIIPLVSGNLKLVERFLTRFSWGDSHINFSIKQ